ncbi:MAG: AAA family ATPase [Candidatus Dormibacteraeota bacterium]|nr:AAA family ATPase [Candidatus Dormibacteraeota bacterium]
MRTLAVTNQKGGIGKTVTVQSLAVALTERGLRVLTVDLDPQANLTMRARVALRPGQATAFDFFVDKLPIADLIVHSPQGYDLVPATDLLEQVDQDSVNELRWPRDLRKGLAHIADRYDYCLLDTAPSVSLRFLIVSALVAATDGVIIPFSPNADAIVGMQKLIARIEQLLPENPDLRVVACLPVRVRDIKVQTHLLEQTRTRLADCTVAEPVLQHADFDKAELYRASIFEIAGTGAGATAYRALADIVVGSAAVQLTGQAAAVAAAGRS